MNNTKITRFIFILFSLFGFKLEFFSSFIAERRLTSDRFPTLEGNLEIGGNDGF